MHIPDGYLGPETYVPLYGVFIGGITLALKKTEQQIQLKLVPWLGMAAAFSFLIMLFNIPIPGGTTGHAVGGAIIALMFGPWAGSIALCAALIIQAFIFGDGGISTLGANCVNMGFILCFSSWYCFRWICPTKTSLRYKTLAAFFSGYLGINLAALATAVELGIQPLIATSSDGSPLYCPYPLSVTIPALLSGHLLFFGLAEGLLTAVVFRYVYKHHPEFIYSARLSACK